MQSLLMHAIACFHLWLNTGSLCGRLWPCLLTNARPASSTHSRCADAVPLLQTVHAVQMLKDMQSWSLAEASDTAPALACGRVLGVGRLNSVN